MVLAGGVFSMVRNMVTELQIRRVWPHLMRPFRI